GCGRIFGHGVLLTLMFALGETCDPFSLTPGSPHIFSSSRLRRVTTTLLRRKVLTPHRPRVNLTRRQLAVTRRLRLPAKIHDPMGLLVHFSPELRTWMLDNLERGCAPERLVASMVENHFEPEIARGLVDAFTSARNAGTALPEDAVTLDLAA